MYPIVPKNIFIIGNKKKLNQHSSKASCDTEDCINDAEKSS